MNGCPKDDFTGTPSLREDARLECKICWYVYDPAEGDPIGQIPAHTPFAALPAAWRCPQCDGGKDQFLRVDASHGGPLD